MNLRVVLHVFRKEGIELLRDRRTLFINVVLPVLLYPLLGLFLLQVAQLTRPSETRWPRISIVNAPPDLMEVFRPNQTTSPRPEVQLFELPHQDLASLRILSDQLDRQPDDRVGSRALPMLRRHDLTAVVVVRQHEADGFADRLMMYQLVDDAHRQFGRAERVLDQVFERYARQRLKARLEARQLPESLLEPVVRKVNRLAPRTETVRYWMGSVVPILLLFMALMGAFIPATDLIAGERERGTLETLLALPGGRREIHCGKLLVVLAAATVTVLLNLLSLGITASLVRGAMNEAAAAGGLSLLEGMRIGVGVLGICLLALLPLVVTVAAVSLAVAGIATSFKEAQNLLSPLFLVVMIPAWLTLLPDVAPSWALDLVPVVGPLVAVKSHLQGGSLPWGHLALASVASTGLAAIVVTWSVGLLNQERFLFPGLVRAGWGRFRRWGRGPAVPGGLEVMALFAMVVAIFIVAGPWFQTGGAVLGIVCPLVAALVLPALVHVWLGAYQERQVFSLRWPSISGWLATTMLVPLCVILSMTIMTLQEGLLGQRPVDRSHLESLLNELTNQGGIGLLLLCVAVAPGLCEEWFFRGSLLSGLRRSLPTWGAVLLSGLCFAALHGDPWRFFPQATLGMILAALVVRQGSILPAMLVHIGHNAVILFVARCDLGRLDISPWRMTALAVLALIGCIAACRLARRPDHRPATAADLGGSGRDPMP